MSKSITRDQINQKARRMLEGRSMPQLLNDWDTLDAMPINEDVAICRGWLMDELERRDANAFDAWLDDYDASPRKYFGAR